MRQRIQTAVIALLMFVPLVLLGGWPFILLIYLLGTIGLIELIKMSRVSNNLAPKILAVSLLWIILGDATGNFAWIEQFSLTKIIFIFIMLLLSYTVISKNKFTFDDAGFILLSIAYIGMGFYFFIHARLEGLNYIFFVLFVIWATDTGAYFTGRYLGKRKLWPEISPNKTIEGAVGGIVSACIIGGIFQIVYPFDFSLGMIIVISLLISVVGQMGDLIASAFKRFYDVKDSSNLLPGHGGILDRFDSLIFVFPLLYIIQFFV